MLTNTQSKQRFFGVLIGNILEHYDTALFSLLAPFLAPLFFPFSDVLTNTVITLSMIPLAKLAKPIGALVLGQIGDRYGRPFALQISLRGIAVSSLIIVVLPTYQDVGIFAPIAFMVCRMAQNFFAAGECMGGAIYLLESYEKKHANIISSFFASSTVAGILLASFGVAILVWVDHIYDGWRLLYLLGSGTAIVGSFLRKSDFEHTVLKQDNHTWIERLKMCWAYKRSMLTLFLASGFSYATYSLVFVFMNVFLPLVTSISQKETLIMSTCFLVVDFLLLPVFAFISRRISQRSLMIGSLVLCSLGGLPTFILLEQGTLLVVLFVRFFLVVLGVWFSATFHAWAQTLLPYTCRFTGITLSYSLGTQLLGAPSAAISLFLFQHTGLVSSPAWYWMGLGVLTLVCMLSGEKKELVK